MINPLIVHRRRALIRRAIMYPLPSILVAPMMHSRQAEAVIRRAVVAVSSPLSARAASCSNGRCDAMLAVRVGAVVAVVLEIVAQGWEGGGEASDACFDVRAEDDVGDPEGEVGLGLEFVDEGDAYHCDD